MSRLPQPGGDSGQWGDILNDYLSQSHNSDGTLKSGVVSNAQLDAATQAAISGKYTKPGTGIPATDLDTSSQSALTQALAANNLYVPKSGDKYRISAADVAGLTDIRPVLDTAIAAAQAAKIPVVSLPAGILPMATQCTIPNGFPITIEGQGEATVLQQTVPSYTKAMFYAAGSEETKVALDADLTAGSTSLTLPTAVASTLAVGDTVGFESLRVVFAPGSGSTQEGNASEYRKVESVSGTTVIVDGPIIWDYTMADSGVAYKVNLAPSVTIRDLWISSSDPSVNKWRLIYLEKCRDILIENITLDNAGGGIYLLDCFGGEVNNVHVNRLQNVSNFLGYGVAVMGRSAEMKIDGLRGRAMRHLFTTLADQRGTVQWGGPRNITISNGVGFGAVAGFSVWDTHPYGYDIVFDNCHAFGGSGTSVNGFQIRSLKTKIINPVVRNVSGVGATVLSTANDCEIIGGEFGYCGLQGIKVAAANVRVRNVRLYNNASAGVGYVGADSLLISGNQMIDNAYGIQDSNAADGSAGVVITNNIIPKSATQVTSMLSIKKPALVTKNIMLGYGSNITGMFTPQAGLQVLANVLDGSTDPSPALLGSMIGLHTLGLDPGVAAAVSTTYAVSSANNAYAAMITPTQDVTVTSLTWVTGSVSTGNYDIGVYDSAGVKIWSKGSTAWPTASSSVVESVTIALTAGVDYWIVHSADNTSATLKGITTNPAQLRKIDGTYWAKQMASAFPLPSTVTLVNASSGKVPLILLRTA